jgi:hypothetical protein
MISPASGHRLSRKYPSTFRHRILQVSHVFGFHLLLLCSFIQKGIYHRVDRVPSFLSSRPSWDSRTPSHACEGVGGRGAHSLAGEGWGGGQFQQGDRHCGTLGIYVLCLWDVLIWWLEENSGPSPQFSFSVPTVLHPDRSPDKI